MKIETTSFTDDTSLALLDTTRAVFAIFMNSDTTAGSSSESVVLSVTVPDPQNVNDLISNTTASPNGRFIVSFFSRPLFALATLYETFDLFYGADLPEAYSNTFNLAQVDRKNCRIILHIW